MDTNSMTNGTTHWPPTPVPTGGLAPAAPAYPNLNPQFPVWYRHPATLSDVDRAKRDRWVALGLGSTERAAEIDRLVRERIVPVAQTRQEALKLLAKETGVSVHTAEQYMRGLRLLTLLSHEERCAAVRKAQRKRRTAEARQATKESKPIRRPVDGLRQAGTKTGGITQEGNAGKQGLKPTSQLRAEAILRPSLANDLTNVERLMTAFRALSPAGRMWALTGLNAEMGREMVGVGK